MMRSWDDYDLVGAKAGDVPKADTFRLLFQGWNLRAPAGGIVGSAAGQHWINVPHPTCRGQATACHSFEKKYRWVQRWSCSPPQPVHKTTSAGNLHDTTAPTLVPNEKAITLYPCTTLLDFRVHGPECLSRSRNNPAVLLLRGCPFASTGMKTESIFMAL